MKTIQKKDCICEDIKMHTTEELVTMCEELGLFKIHKVMDGENETDLWTFTIIDSY